MPYYHRNYHREMVIEFCRGWQAMGKATEVPKAAWFSCHLPPGRLTVVVLVNVPKGVFAPIRTITHDITYIARAAGDATTAEVTTVILAGFVHTATPRWDEVGAGFHRLPPLKQ